MSRLYYRQENLGLGGALAVFAFFIAVVAAWATHVIWIIQKLASDGGATMGQIALGVIGAFMPPIGVIHGLILWFT